MTLKSYIIHLERAGSRKANVAKLLDFLPNAEVVPAVDGSALRPEEKMEFYPGKVLFSPKYPFPLSNGEIGCFGSHRKVWEMIVEAGLPYALVVEDDVEVDSDTFSRTLEMAKKSIGSDGYVQFQVRDVNGQTHLVAKGDGQLLRPTHVPLRTSSQLVSLGAARNLLEKTEAIDRPVDTFVQMYWETGVDVFCAVPSGVTDLTEESGGSTISRKRNAFQKLSAEVKRGLYRHKIRSLSKRHWPY